jgi:hypothetical protein
MADQLDRDQLFVWPKQTSLEASVSLTSAIGLHKRVQVWIEALTAHLLMRARLAVADA